MSRRAGKNAASAPAVVGPGEVRDWYEAMITPQLVHALFLGDVDTHRADGPTADRKAPARPRAR